MTRLGAGRHRQKVLGAGAGTVPQTTGLHNKELERTRSTQTAVGPRRSIQCYTTMGPMERETV